jgi:phosphoribosylformylglycinamidine synthase
MMKFGVIRFPGSNCDDDAVHAASLLEGASAEIVWHKDTGLPALDAVIVPGGFSYGDYLRSGAIAAHSPIMAAVREFADRGGPVLGICNGFQILCEAGLLDGALTRNASLRFQCEDVWCVVEGRPTPFTHAIPAGRHIRMSIANAEGRYVHPDPDTLETEGRVVFRYATADGEVSDAANPNGSMRNIAGICNSAGNVVGLMPHPERAFENLLGGGEDGRSLLLSALSSMGGGPARVP